MLTADENDRLTRVTGDAPMGQMMRKWTWMPFALSTQIKVGDAPHKVRLLGEDYVAWRAPDGRIGFIREACPHRGASMALARNEGCQLRCIFHGWTIGVEGKVREVPTQHLNPEAFAAHVDVVSHPVREGAGLAWVWLGGEPVADFPALPIFDLPEGHVWMTVSRVPCNWLQGVEAQLDSAHLGTLHSSWLSKVHEAYPDGGKVVENRAPRYETEPAPWGLSAAALRGMDDEGTFIRVTQYVAPYFSLIPAKVFGEGSIFMAVPVDDHNHLFFFGFFAHSHVITDDDPRVQFGVGNGRIVHDDFARFDGGREENYGQDRAAMARGHFSGFTDSLLQEDLVVQVSMGPIVNRVNDHLSSADMAIVRMRKMLLKAMTNHEAGLHPLGPAHKPYATNDAYPIELNAPAGMDWKVAVRALRPEPGQVQKSSVAA